MTKMMLVWPLMTNLKMMVRDDCTVSACTPPPHPTLPIKVLTLCLSGAFLVAQRVKRLPALWETWVRSLGRGDSLEKEMAIHFSILAWRIPWTEEPGRLQSRGSQRVRHNWTTSLSFFLSFLLVKGESAFGQISTTLHAPPSVASIWNKAYFPFHQPILLTGSGAMSSRAPHAYLCNSRAEGCLLRSQKIALWGWKQLWSFRFHWSVVNLGTSLPGISTCPTGRARSPARTMMTTMACGWGPRLPSVLLENSKDSPPTWGGQMQERGRSPSSQKSE